MSKNITGYDYESICASYLKKHGYRHVHQTKASGDQGVDIIAKKHGHWWGIQCKYYSSSVANKAVQEAYTGAKFYGCDRAMVITNSYFTDSAMELAKTTNVELVEWMQPCTFRHTLKKAPPYKKKHTFMIAFILAAAVVALAYFWGIKPNI